MMDLIIIGLCIYGIYLLCEKIHDHADNYRNSRKK